jgi:solute carrier family 25 aspartate/glutamate transporter 12/13
MAAGGEEGREGRLIRQLTEPRLDQPDRPKSEQDEKLIRLALHQNPFFTCLDEEQVARFVKAAQLKSYSPGEVVILEGYIDDGSLEGDDFKLDAKGLLKKLLTFERIAYRKTNLSDLKPKADSLSTTEDKDVTINDDAGKESSPKQISHEDDVFLHDEDGEAYGSLDAFETTDSSAMLDPTATENFGGMNGVVQEEESKSSGRSLRMSGIPSFVYAVRSGSADIYHGNVHVASCGPGTIFGEGGFLFHRQHSGTVTASQSGELECWVVPAKIFRNYVLPSKNMILMFAKFASRVDEHGNPYMIMDDFVRSCLDREGMETDYSARIRMANTYNILRKTDGIQKINLADFCLFHLLMARPDPEVDIAFLIMDQNRTGTITLDDLIQFLGTHNAEHAFELDCDFIKRHFGRDGKRTIRPNNFPQFLTEFQREMGKQAFLHEMDTKGSPEGYLLPQDFVKVLKTACGWRLPANVAERLDNLYVKAPMEAAEAAALMSVQAEKLKGSSQQEVTKSTTASILASIERRSKLLGDRYYTYGDFLAFQEVLQQLPGICNLIHGACAIKKGPISPDDFKVANRVIGLGGKLSRRQVEIVFQLFDLDHDGFISAEDTASVMGVDFAYKLEATTGREGKLTFAPPPDHRQEFDAREVKDDISVDLIEDDESSSLISYISGYLRQLGLGAAAGSVGAVVGLLLAPADLVKTRMQNQRIRPDGFGLYSSPWDCLTRAYKTEGLSGLFRGNLPYLVGIIPQRAFQLTVYNQICTAFGVPDAENGGAYSSVLLQIIAGGVAGACQVLFANPLEIAKIELQTERETHRQWKARGSPVPPPSTFTKVAKDLGGTGFYTGAASCLWRDIPFSAMFFPLYYRSKQLLKAIEGYPSNPSQDAFLAGTVAAIPSAMLTTPADVIKTRLQSPRRDDGVIYTGLRQCATHIYKHEGPLAFFKGAGLRAVRAAPQLGLTMAVYEKLPTLLGVGEKRSKQTLESFNDSSDYRRTYPMRGYGGKAEDIDGLLQNMGVKVPKQQSDNERPPGDS